MNVARCSTAAEHSKAKGKPKTKHNPFNYFRFNYWYPPYWIHKRDFHSWTSLKIQSNNLEFLWTLWFTRKNKRNQSRNGSVIKIVQTLNCNLHLSLVATFRTCNWFHKYQMLIFNPMIWLLLNFIRLDNYWSFFKCWKSYHSQLVICWHFLNVELISQILTVNLQPDDMFSFEFHQTWSSLQPSIKLRTWIAFKKKICKEVSHELDAINNIVRGIKMDWSDVSWNVANSIRIKWEFDSNGINEGEW
jgi:hypothetical protein